MQFPKFGLISWWLLGATPVMAQINAGSLPPTPSPPFKVVQRESASARQLRAVPGIGLLGATALAATLVPAHPADQRGASGDQPGPGCALDRAVERQAPGQCGRRGAGAQAGPHRLGAGRPWARLRRQVVLDAAVAAPRASPIPTSHSRLTAASAANECVRVRFKK